MMELNLGKPKFYIILFYKYYNWKYINTGEIFNEHINWI